jgi:predicted MFS family arabinose efflux permease
VSQKTKSNAFLFAALVLFAINILNFYDRNAPGALVEPMRREFHLNDTQIGLIGSVFIWLYAIVGVPLGRIADTWSRKKLLAWGVLVWSSLTAFAAFAKTYNVLLFSRMGVGLGEAVCAPTATSWIGDICPPTKRARALAVFMLGVPVGSALSFFFSGPIAQAYGWRAAMVIAAAPAVVLVPLLLLLEEPERGACDPHPAPRATGSVWSILRIPTLWWIIGSGVFINFNLYALGTFLPTFFGRVHGLSVSRSGISTGIVYMIGGLGGGFVAGYVGDSIVHRRKDGRLRAAAVFALLAAPFASFGVLQSAGSLLAAIVLLTLAYGTLTTYYGLVYSAIQDIVAPNQRGTTMAVYFMAMYMCGASFGPLLTGRLSDYLAHRAATLAGSEAITPGFRAIGLQQAMLIVPVLAVALAFVLYMGSRTICSDIEARETAALGLAVETD